jgi:uncharacterized membrane protein
VYRTAAVLLGVGLGGLVDGILLHELLQWHHAVSAVVPPTSVEALSANLRWDGAFDALCLALTVGGALTLYRAALHRMPVPGPRLVAGFFCMGWGLFNIVEGIVDHEILGIHHVREGAAPIAWDFGFLAVGGFGLFAVGAVLSRPTGDWLQRRGGRRRG